MLFSVIVHSFGILEMQSGGFGSFAVVCMCIYNVTKRCDILNLKLKGYDLEQGIYLHGLCRLEKELPC